jgi:hypothetical protein
VEEEVIVIPTEAYPLKWPAGVPRTKDPQPSKFATTSRNEHGWRTSHNRTIFDASEELRRQLKLLKAKNIVVSSNLPTREDGMPISKDTAAPRGDAAVAVYWSVEQWRQKQWVQVPHCMPCDRWNRLADNIYAVALSIEAMRGMDRWGAVSVEQAFAGFRALPSGSGDEVIPQQPMVDWRTILGGSWPEDLDAAEVLAIAKARHRKLIATAHPDAGGRSDHSAELNAAIEAAEQELKSR